MTTLQTLLIAAVISIATSKVVHFAKDHQELEANRRDGAPGTGNCTIVKIIDWKITVRVCLVDLEGCEFQVYESDGVTKFKGKATIHDWFPDDCVSFTSKGLGRNENYILRIVCEIKDSETISLAKPFNSADMLCPRTKVIGEPHWTSWDGLHIDFQGKPGCIYTWIKDNFNTPSQFEIQTRLGLSPLATSTNILTRVDCVIIIIRGFFIKLLIDNKVQIGSDPVIDQVNGIIELDGGNITIFGAYTEDAQGGVHFETNVFDEGRMWISYNGINCAEVSLFDPVCLGDGKQIGIAGDTDDPPDVTDDLKKPPPGGQLPVTRPVPKDIADEFGNSWEVSCPAPVV